MGSFSAAAARAAGRCRLAQSATLTRLLHRVLERAVEAETVARNVAHAVAPPKVREQGNRGAYRRANGAGSSSGWKATRSIRSSPLRLPPACAAASCCALRWTDLDLDGATVRIERSLGGDEGRASLQVAEDTSWPAHHIAAGERPRSRCEPIGKRRWRPGWRSASAGPEPDALVFAQPDGSPMSAGQPEPRLAARRQGTQASRGHVPCPSP